MSTITSDCQRFSDFLIVEAAMQISSS